MAFVTPTSLFPPLSTSKSSCSHRGRHSRPHIPLSKLRYPNPSSTRNDASDTPFNHSQPPPSSTVDTNSRPVPSSDVKQELITAVSGTNRGFVVTPYQSDQILSLVAELEKSNPSDAPADDPMLFGKWRLVFTDALDVLSLGLLAPIAQVAQINQNIFEVRPEQKKSYEYDLENVVMLEPWFAPLSNSFFGRTVAEIKVFAEGKRKNESRIDITFVKTALRQKSVLGYDLPSELPPASLRVASAVGYIKTTYLDAELRVARSPPLREKRQGNVFLLAREQ